MENKSSKPLEDTDAMPFGRWRGVPMQDVPTHWLHWFYCKADLNTPDAFRVFEYIERSMDALKEEDPDKIWKRDKK